LRLNKSSNNIRNSVGKRRGASKMPSKIDLYQIGVWFCVGFFTGAG
jgi:hypothetical protein